MDQWNRVRLSDTIEIIGGGTPKTIISGYWNGPIPWISVVDFQGDNKHVYQTEKTITQEGLDNSSTKILPKGSVIISARGTVGEVGVLGHGMAFNQSCYGLIGKQDLINNDFLYYILKYKVNQLKSHSHGSVFSTITRTTFNEITIDLPSLKEQHRIASILSALDDKIELNLEMNKTLEAMAMAIYKEWFVDFGPFRDGEFVDSELGPIPRGWEVKKIGDITSFRYGKALKESDRKHGLIPVYGSSGIVGYHSESFVQGPTLIIGRKGNVGSVYWESSDCYPIDTVYYINDLPLELLYHLYFKLINTDFQSRNSDSVVPGLNRSLAENEPLIMPPTDVYKRCMPLIESLFALKLANIDENKTLASTRDYLLPKLISGEIRVKEAEEQVSDIV